ncbi:SEC-C domain-containing protein [bacterium]|nr:SEC-C domain-containing protein [bacterium]
MVKIGRNNTCPCGSGKKYKKCCLNNPRKSPQAESGDNDDITSFIELSNSINDLLENRNFKKARAVCRQLLNEYPEQIEGISRFAQVYEAMGDRVRAAEYYRKSAEFAATNEGFDPDAVDMYFEDAERMESGE